MKTKLEIIAKLKTEYPTLRSGDDQRGYEDLSPTDFEATIEAWAENQFAEQNAITQAEADKAALLAKLGIDKSDLTKLLS